MLSLAVKLDGIERRKRSTGLLHIAAGCFLLAKGVDYLVYFNYQRLLVTVPVFAVVLVSIVYGFLKRKIDPAARFNHWVRLMQVCMFTILGINFIGLGRQLDVIVLLIWAIICLFLMFTERKVFHDSHMVFNKNGIYIPGYFKSHRLFWNNIKEVVARPDYITIFKGDDKFVQLEVLKNVTPAELETINTYCQQQIKLKTNTTI
jgi:hypothetical protein